MATFVPDTAFLMQLIVASLLVTAMISLVIYFSGITRLFERRRVFLGKWIGEIFQVVSVLKVNALTEVIPITKGGKKTTIIFDSSKPTFRTKKNTWIYCVDVEKSHVLLNPQEYKVPNWIYDDVLTRGGLRHTLAGLGKNSLSGFIMYILIGVIMALPVGIMVGAFFLSVK
jgi:hypothetical protein